MIVRQAVEADHSRVLPFLLGDPIAWIDAQRYTRDVASGSYRADRIWLAEDNTGRVLGCAIWWGFRESEHPLILDCLYVDRAVADRIALGAKLLRAGQAAFLSNGAQNLPRYEIFLKAGWREDSGVRTEVDWRRAAAQSADLTVEGERLRYEWTPDAGLEPSSLRLLFSPDPDDNVFLDAFQRVAVGSLDQETRRDLISIGPEHHARKTLACNRRMPGNRAWWRVAHLADGTLVGFTIPSANEDNPVIGYLGVVPELRGHGYAGELLAEATRILSAEGAKRIRADTDTTNRPMAAAFERARYQNFGVRLMFSAL
jgi:GNAT superfamily N-acetyltransferase